jgi:peptidoglycan/LPS O-acetylase OafA/YrhL
MLMLPNLLGGTNVPNVTWTLSYEMVFYLMLAALFSWNQHRRSGSYALACGIGALALGGILPMSALSNWAGSSGHGGLILDLVADALILGGIACAVSGRKWLVRIGSSAAAATALTLITVNQDYPYPWSGCTILGLMFTGTLIYRAEQGQTGKLKAAVISVAVLAALIAAGLWHGAGHGGQWEAQWASSLVLAAVTFGIGLAIKGLRIPKALAWLGLVSYSVYLLHPLAFDAYRDIRVLHQHHPMGIQIALAAAIVAVILAASAAGYYFIEKPMQNLGRRLTKRWPEPQPSPAAAPRAAP